MNIVNTIPAERTKISPLELQKAKETIKKQPKDKTAAVVEKIGVRTFEELERKQSSSRPSSRKLSQLQVPDSLTQQISLEKGPALNSLFLQNVPVTTGKIPEKGGGIFLDYFSNIAAWKQKSPQEQAMLKSMDAIALTYRARQEINSALGAIKRAHGANCEEIFMQHLTHKKLKAAFADLSPEIKQAFFRAFVVERKSFMTEVKSIPLYYLKGEKNGTRVPYEPNKENFQNLINKLKEHEYSFHHMKASYMKGDETVTKEEMQMLCDFRAALYELDYFPDLMESFVDLQSPSANSVGSVQLTSDWDIVFAIGPHDQVTETRAAKEFNTRFRKEFGLEAAIVLDTNTYSNQYERRARDPAKEKENGQIDNRVTRLMARMITPKRIQTRLDGLILEKIADPALKSKYREELQAADEECKALVGRQNKEMLKILNDLGVRFPDKIAQAYRDHLEGEDCEWCLSDEIAGFFHDLKAKKSFAIDQAEKQAKNILHEKIKTSYHEVELSHAKLHHLLCEEVGKLTQGEADEENINTLKMALNEEIDRLLEELSLDEEESEELSALREAKVFLNNYPQEVFSAFKTDLRVSQEGIVALKRRTLIEEDRNHILLQKLKVCHLRECILSLENSSILDELGRKTIAQHNQEIAKIKQELAAIRSRYGSDVQMNAAAQVAEEAMKMNREEKRAAITAGWRVISALNQRLDNMMIAMQEIQTVGMIFADEAHVGKSAFQEVVEVMQRGEKTVPSIRNAVNAAMEIRAFSFDHMAKHPNPPEAMLAHGAKYAQRLFIEIDRTIARCNALAIEPPRFEMPFNERLKIFFTHLAPNRSKSGAELKQICEKLADQTQLRAPGGFEKTAEAIVEHLISVVATLEAFRMQIPEEKQELIFNQ